MDDHYLRKVTTTLILAILLVLSFFLLRPILFPIVLGLILAFIFSPVYDWALKRIHSQNLVAALICLILFLLILLPIWFLTPIFIEQSFKVYLAAQQIDFITPLQSVFPSMFASEAFSSEVGSILHSFTTQIANSFSNYLSNIILNFPTLFLKFLVAAFTFFFVLRDRDKLLSYIKSLLPFSKDIEKKLFESSKAITFSVIYGQVIVGILQGLVVGMGFFIFGVSNALFLTLLACLAGIFPIIGTIIVWLPTAIYLFIAGNTFAAIGLVLFGLISSGFDNFARPLIVSKRSRMPTSLILIGMIGGLFFFGVLGFILGPLILAYLLIILEVYRYRQHPGIFINHTSLTR